MVDNSLALMVKPPQELQIPNALEQYKPLMLLSQIRNAETQNQLAQFQLGQMQGGQNALTAYQERGGSSNPEAAKALDRYPEIQANIFKNLGTLEANKQQKVVNSYVNGANEAFQMMQYPEGSPERNQMFKASLDKRLANKELDQETYDRAIASGPTDASLTMAHKLGMSVQERFQLDQPKFGKIGGDIYGNEQYGFVEPSQKRVTPANISTAAGVNQANPLSSDLSGKEFLDTLPASMAAQVKAYVEGRSIPVGNARSPQVQAVKRLAAQYEPGFDESVYKSREATRKDFSAGTAAKNVTSLNTVMGHLNDLRETADNLNNRGFTLWNKVTNAASDVMGYPGVKEFSVARQAVADEMAKVFRSSGMSEAETERWLQSFDSSSSPPQFKAVISRGLSLLDSRMSSLADQYNRGMKLGPNDAEKTPEDLLNNDAKAKLGKIRNWIIGTKEGDKAIIGQPLPGRPGETVIGVGREPPTVGLPPAPSMPTVKTLAEYDKLKSGTEFIGSDGKPWRKP